MPIDLWVMGGLALGSMTVWTAGLVQVASGRAQLMPWEQEITGAARTWPASSRSRSISPLLSPCCSAALQRMERYRYG
jgi:hypothetical protein